MLKLNEAHPIPSYGFLSLCLVIVYGVVQMGRGGGGGWLIYGKHGIFKSRSPTLLTLYFWVEWLV